MNSGLVQKDQDGPQLASVVTGRALACKSSLSVTHKSGMVFDLLYVSTGRSDGSFSCRKLGDIKWPCKST